MKWLDKLKQGLAKSSSKISESIHNLVHKRKLDQETLDDLESLLIMADLGTDTAEFIINKFKKNKFNKEVTSEEINQELSSLISELLEPNQQEYQITHKPQIMLVCGVNGSGKTTTIGKLVAHFQKQGKRVLLGACDTFRAAAIEQLVEWAKRNDCQIVTGQANSDPASVAYKAVEQAINESYDLLIIDTAGRLHNKEYLMAELAKIEKVIKKIDPNAPHTTLLVLDATTGQNAKIQLEKFSELLNINGLVVTKLDGTAKAGVLVSIAYSSKLPIYFIGLGEKTDDLIPFDAKHFANNLLG